MKQYHDFSTEAEYKVYLAEEERREQAADEQAAEMDRHETDGSTIGDVDTDLSFEEWWNS